MSPNIPFLRVPALELLGLDARAPMRDDNFYRFGWARLDAVVLREKTGAVEVANPLVVALHTPDDAQPGRLTLEFWYDHNGEELCVQQPWRSFAPNYVSPLSHTADDVVVALCNPHHVEVSRPEGWGRARMHTAQGDVRAWLVEGSVELAASAWRCTDGV